MSQSEIIQEILAERKKQDTKWGEQNHSPIEWLAILGEETGEASKIAVDAHFLGTQIQNYRKEMIQVAAVVLAAIESFDRNQGNRK